MDTSPLDRRSTHLTAVSQTLACKLCGGHHARLVETLRRKPLRETEFGVPGDRYRREIWRCDNCDVFFNHHDLLTDQLYRDQYNEATYGRDLAATYQRIRALPASQSDNKQRIRRVAEYYAAHGNKSPRESRVLDVGSGLCVFLAEMKELGFECHAIDPDPMAAEHARKCAGVDYAFAGTLDTFPLTDARYDIISFNKVLEHVADAVSLLASAARFLKPDGFIYLEVPDGQAALAGGTIGEREEFYVEHATVFTPASAQWLIAKAGLELLELQSIHEPSDKYTLYAFARRLDRFDWPARQAVS